MAIIYTYPSTPNVEADDLLLISDDSDGKKTKSVSLGTIKSFVGGGSAAFLTVQTENGGTIVNNVVDIKVTDGTLTDNGNGIVTIATDSGSSGVTETSGTWIPVLGKKDGVNGSLFYLNIIQNITSTGRWRRIGSLIYHDFYIQFDIQGVLTASDLVLGAGVTANSNDVWGIPVDATTPSATSPTVSASQTCNGSCQITQATGPATMWEKMPQTGKVSKNAAGIVSLASHNYQGGGALTDPLQTVFTQDWWSSSDPQTCYLAGTIISEV